MTTAAARRRHRLTPRLPRAALLAGALLASCVTPAAAAPAPTSPAAPPQSSTAGAQAHKAATFGIGPADGKRIDGRPLLTYLASPGAHLTDHVAIVNLAAKSVTLNVYAADAAIGADGSFGYLAKAAPRKDASAWIKVMTPGQSPKITLAPRATVILPIIVTVPADASPGDHAAGVITSLTSKITSSKGQLIDFEQRVALRTFVRVSGPLHPQLAIEKLQVKYRDTLNPVGGGKVTVSYTVRNTGNVRLGARQQVIISGLFGTTSAKALADVPLLLPKSSVAVSVTVPGVFPQLHMHARVVLVPLTVAGDVDPGLPTKIIISATLWAVPWALIAALVLLLCAVLLWVWRRRRSRRPPADPDDSGDDLQPAGAPKPEGARA